MEDNSNLAQAVLTVRMLAADAVQKANSGHPGAPMGMADYAVILWLKYLRYQPRDPRWPNRDRFVLSAGHACMLLYGLLHLAGFDLSLDDIQHFRQLGSRTPGHPEFGHTPGVEATTGPLGQGFGNGVGMALGAKMLAAQFNREDFSPVTHRVFGIVSDGDLMEGVASEAASLAGHLQLGNLVYIYDDNHITIEGDTSLAFTEDVGARFSAYGWQVQHIDGHDHGQITAALDAAIAEVTRPSLIVARTHIALGSPHKQDTKEAHGSPLGEDEVRLTKEVLEWPLSPAFCIPAEVQELFARRNRELVPEYRRWQEQFSAWKETHPDLAQLWDQRMSGWVPDNLEEGLLAALPAKPAATRVHSGAVIQAAAALVPSLCGGSADLSPSTETIIKDGGHIGPGNWSGRNFHFGIREHAMGAILNGLALHGGFLPFGATFLIFSDYMRPSIRLAALSKLDVIYVFTHDSIFLGEDGPTHEPVEHLAALRAIPNLELFRPADGPETAAAWAAALRRRGGPTALALTRQNLPILEREEPFDPAQVARGGYVLTGSAEESLVLVATGSEVSLACQTRQLLSQEGIPCRVVSMPCLERFRAQPREYQEGVIPPRAGKVVVEAGRAFGWAQLVGNTALMITQETYGASAPLKDLAEHFGFTGPQVASRVKEWLKAAPAGKV